MMLPLNVSSILCQALHVHYISLATWFRYLLNVKNGGLLIGGFDIHDHFAGVCLREFWRSFAVDRAGHAVFDLHGSRLHRVVPFAVHLDEGRGLRKSAVLVVHAQTIFGAETAPNFMEEFNFSWQEGLSDEKIGEIMRRNQFHNARGSTYRTRMLYTVLPKASYTKRNKNVYGAVLDQLRQECTDLLENGVRLRDGRRFYFCLVAVKGDAPALAKAGNFTRNFQCLGNAICWECMAGAPAVPFEDCRRAPLYEATMYAERPWCTAGPLAEVPGVPGIPEAVYRRDPFHVFKQALGGYYVASSIVLVAELGYWEATQNSFDQVMERSYADFLNYVRECSGRVVPHLKHFTRTNLHYARTSSFPYMRPKGSDVMLLTRWLGFLMHNGPYMEGERKGSMIQNPLEEWHSELFQHIAAAAAGAVKFFRLMHNNGLWLSRVVAHDMAEGAFQFCEAYTSLATLCHNRRLSRYTLVPSLHYFHHFYVDLKKALSNPQNQYISSPALANCEGDEDYIGKICKISRHVHPLVTNRRTIDRFLVRMNFVMEEGAA